MSKSLALAMIFALAVGAFSKEQEQKAPDTIFINGNIYTGVTSHAGGKPMRARAIAVSNGRVIAYGGNSEIRKLAGKQTRVVDLDGKFVMPGFNDAHAHMASAGFAKLNVDLAGSRSLAEMQQRIAERVKHAEEGEWITGRGWDHTTWPGQTLPTRADLDKITGGHPAIFNRVDGHISVANSVALRAAGITRDTPDPAGGKIDRDASGEATGILRETPAEILITTKIPAPSHSQWVRAIEVALQDAAQWGITSVQDNSDCSGGKPYTLDCTRENRAIYEDLLQLGKLTTRITQWMPFDAPLEELKRFRAQARDSVMLRTGLLKGYMDGSLGSRTAALLAPYSDDHSNSGIPRYTAEYLAQATPERVAAGFQIAFHAIGDRGAEMALDAFEAANRKAMGGATGGDVAGEAAKDAARGASKTTARNDLRFRIEHAQVVDHAQLKRFRELGVIASVQPNHLLTDMNWAESRVGPERARQSYPWADFLQAGVPLAFGTDYPVEPVTPFRGLYAAVTRKNEAGTASYYSEQKLTIDQAIAAYTTGPAFAEFMEKEKGTLAPGMLADFVVLDRDITAVAPAEILKTRVLRTMVGGKMVYEAQ